jgi:hypothetical protein
MKDQLGPCTRTKRSSRTERNKRNALGISSILPHIIPPPTQIEPTLGVLHAEKNDEQAEPDAGVEPRRQDVVVPHPPPEMNPPHIKVEYKPNDSPRRVVDSRGRWDSTYACEENRDVDVSPDGEWVSPGEEVEWNRSHGTD